MKVACFIGLLALASLAPAAPAPKAPQREHIDLEAADVDNTVPTAAAAASGNAGVLAPVLGNAIVDNLQKPHPYSHDVPYEDVAMEVGRSMENIFDALNADIVSGDVNPDTVGFAMDEDMLAAIKAKIASGEVKTGLMDILVQLREAVLAETADATPIIKAILDEVKAAIDELTTVAKAHAEAGIEMGKDQLAELLPKIIAKMAEIQSKKSLEIGSAIELNPFIHMPNIQDYLRIIFELLFFWWKLLI